MKTYEAVVVGASAGGGAALRAILSKLPGEFPLPILVAQHLHPSDEGRFATSIADVARMSVATICDKQAIEPGRIYIAPARYHMLVEKDRTIALSVDEKVKWSRPSIDVLFDSAARVYGGQLIAVILSGANDDGADGMRAVRQFGGYPIVQDPATAESPTMPLAAIQAARIETVVSLGKIGELLIDLSVLDGAKQGAKQ